MAQHQTQPLAPFNALKPATWGSLKLLPLALRSKLTGAKGSEDPNRVAFGKENAGGQPAGLQAPPQLGDLSHLHAIGPRRNVNQRYVLQPNLSVSRPAVATHAPGLSGLLLPGVTPIATQYPKKQQQQQQQENAATPLQPQQHSSTPLRQRSSTPVQQRSSTPSSPSLRGRLPHSNPNFGPPASNISTRLPTPVRINASPGPSPSPTSIALTIPKPPTPSRSLSQSGAAPLANPFTSASACSSPAASTSTGNPFVLPTPPSILASGPPPRASRGGAATAAVPWAAAANAHPSVGQGAANSSLTPTSVRPSPQPQERSILASVQLPYNANHQQQQLRSAQAAAVPGHSENLAPVVAPAPMLAGGGATAAAGVSPVLSAPAIQAALQQALQGAVERKPETFGRVVDNFEHFFDSLMHPGHPGKLDGPLPHELPEELRYGDNWYRHCRDRRNGFDQPATPCSAPAAAGHESTPVGRRFTSTPFAEAPDDDAAPIHDQARAAQLQQLQKPAWSMEEPPMSDACVKALEVAHHGLRRVLTPTARSRSASDCTAGAAQRGGAGAPSLLELAEQRLLRVQAAMAAESELDDTAASRPRQVAASPEVAQTAAALTSALESLARDQASAAATAGLATEEGRPSSPQRCLAAALTLADTAAATPVAAPLVDVAVMAEVELAPPEAADAAAEEEEPLAARNLDGIEASASPVRLAGRPPVGSRRFTVPALLIRSLEAPLRPNAAGAALSPPPDSARPNGPDSARPPSTAATTPGPKTPGGGACDSVATTAATTPVGRGSVTALTTPRTGTAAQASATSPLLEATAATATTATQELDVAAAACLPAAVEGPPAAGSTAAAAAPLRSLSRELAAAECPVEAAPPQASVPVLVVEPVAGAAVEAGSPAMPSAVLWSPAFPPVVPAAVMARGAAAVAGALPQQRPPSPVTLLQNAPRDMPTPNPAFFSSAAAAAPAAGAASLAAAVAAVAAPSQATGAAAQSGAVPSTSKAAAAADPLKEIVVGIEKLSTLKQNILAEDKEVDVASITQMIQLKLAVEQLLARTSTAMQQDAPADSKPAATAVASAAPPPPQAVAAAPSAPAAHTEQAAPVASAAVAAASTPKKHSRSATFGAFLKSVFSPRSGSASKAPQAPLPPSSASGKLGATNSIGCKGGILSGAPSCVNTAAAEDARPVPASPVTAAVGVRVPRPMSASAVPRQAASPSVTDRSRYAALHQRAAARLAEAAAEPAASRPSPAVKTGAGSHAHGLAGPQGQRGAVWQRYEEKIAMHRQQLDTTKSQLDEAVRKLNDMQTEFDELLLCLGMESAKNKALCDAMRAAGLDPEPILAAIEEQWMSGAMQ